MGNLWRKLLRLLRITRPPCEPLTKEEAERLGLNFPQVVQFDEIVGASWKEFWEESHSPGEAL